MHKKRIVIASVAFLFAFTVIFFRTGYLLLKDTSDITAQVSNQVGSKSFLFYPRGKIYDRNMITLSGRIENKTVPIPMYDADVGKSVIGELYTDTTKTSKDAMVGTSGLQQLYDKQLNGGNPLRIALYSDATGAMLDGENIMVYSDHANTGNSIITTLDYHMQQAAENIINKAIDKNDYKGIAVVLEDVKTGEIRAMASVGDETNKALLCFQPGSTFKILVAAKALEMGTVDLDTPFQCNDSIMIDGVEKHCNEEGGHGNIAFIDAFAQSCNLTLYQTALLLNDKENYYNKVLDLAKEFGFNSVDEPKKKEFMLSYEQTSGFEFISPTVPSKIVNNMDVFNLALGQGDVMASPLTITKVAATIANDGILIEPTLVKEIVDYEGKTISESDNPVEKTVISKHTNDKMKKLMEEVCISGTGMNNTLEELGGLAGKSGTAQHISDRKSHAWFTGYFPASNPTYAMTVFVQEGGASTTVALPIYDKIAREILNLYPETEDPIVEENANDTGEEEEGYD